MNPSAIAQVALAMVLPELVKYGLQINWRGVESRFDVQMQKLIPLHWVEGPVQKAGDLVLEACAAAFAQHPAEVRVILQDLGVGDVPKAEADFLKLVVAVEPQVAGLLVAA